jgi:hypothetical protein
MAPKLRFVACSLIVTLGPMAGSGWGQDVARAPAATALRCLQRWDFEDGLQGWGKWSNQEMAQEVRTDNAYAGQRALWGRVNDAGACMVHLLQGLDIPIAGTRLRVRYFVPAAAEFGFCTVNLRTHEHGEQANPQFQVALGLTKGRWDVLELPFAEFFGYAERAFGSFRVRTFEIATTGRGEIWLDDVEVLQDPAAAAVPERVPAVIWIAGEEPHQAAGGSRAHFRKGFELPAVPRTAWLQVAGDDEATVFVNGTEVGKAGRDVAEFDIASFLRPGRNVVALAVLNHGTAPNPTGAAAVLGWGDVALDEEVLVSDDSWKCSRAGPEGWTTATFDDSTWEPAVAQAKVPAPPAGILDIYPLRRPLDRRLPDLVVEVDPQAGVLRGVLKPRRPLPTPTPFQATLSTLSAEMAATAVAELDGALPGGASEQRLELFPAPSRGGAYLVTLRFPELGASLERVVWLPATLERQSERPTLSRGEATGTFHTQKIGGRWWLVDPGGNLFFSTACNAVMHEGYYSRHYSRWVADHYADPATWREVALSRLLGWGFNTDDGLLAGAEPVRRPNVPYFAGWNLLWAGPWLQGPNGERTQFPDVFDPDWRRGAEARVIEVTSRFRDDPLLIGYWTDNEIQMHDPLSPGQGVMDRFWSPGCQAEISRWLRERYHDDIAALNARWSSGHHTYAYGSFGDIATDKPTSRGPDDPVAPDLKAFVRHLIKTYCDTYVALWKKHDPRHLVCSNRFAGQFDTDFADLLSAFDLIACNSYPRSRWGQTEFDQAQLDWLRRLSERSGRPVIVSEWGTMARDTGLTNVWGRLDTQAQRGQAYATVLDQLWQQDYVVGAHWFGWGDSTDAERANWGLVDAFDRPYLPLTTAMQAAHRHLQDRVQAWKP